MDRAKVIKSIEEHIILCKSRKNLSDLDMANSLHMVRQTFYNKRQGETSWLLDEILILCDLCECTPNELFSWNTEGK